MGVIVQKYGGSSVAGVEKIQRVAARVAETRAQGHEVVVVVSAMGDTTDELLALAQKVSSGNPHRRELDMLLTAGERISGVRVRSPGSPARALRAKYVVEGGVNVRAFAAFSSAGLSCLQGPLRIL